MDEKVCSALNADAMTGLVFKFLHMLQPVWHYLFPAPCSNHRAGVSSKMKYNLRVVRRGEDKRGGVEVR